MKVLYILHDTIMGGATISFLKMIEGLSMKGVDIAIVVPKRDEEFERCARNFSSEIVVAPIRRSILPNWEKGFLMHIYYLMKFPYSYNKLLLRKRLSRRPLLEIIKRIKPDIVHTNVGIVHEGFWCTKKLDIPHVWHLREYQDKDFNRVTVPSKSRFKKYLKQSFVISITKGIHRHFDLCESNRHRVIYNGVLPASVSALDFPKEKFFLCASRVSWEKGHEDVVRCFSEFYQHYPDYRLVILGFGEKDYIDFLMQLSKQLGCDDAIDFKGYTDDVSQYMRTATALIVASYNEGFGRMTAEASFYGCMVIGRGTGGTKEIMDETGGFQFLTNEELLQQMIKIAQMSEAEYRQLVLKAQSKAIELYSTENNVNSVEQFYMDILNNKAKDCER